MFLKIKINRPLKRMSHFLLQLEDIDSAWYRYIFAFGLATAQSSVVNHIFHVTAENVKRNK